MLKVNLAKLKKYFNEDQELHARVNLRFIVKDCASRSYYPYRFCEHYVQEDVSQDMYGSIDLVVDKIERQIQ